MKNRHRNQERRQVPLAAVFVSAIEALAKLDAEKKPVTFDEALVARVDPAQIEIVNRAILAAYDRGLLDGARIVTEHDRAALTRATKALERAEAALSG